MSDLNAEVVVDPTVEPAPTMSPRAARRLPRRMWWVAAGAGAATLATRAPLLTHPNLLVFDEVFYATQGWEISRTGVEQGLTVHPPLAKWLLAVGIKIFGFTPLGWRIVPLLAGVLVVVATVIVAARLLDHLAATLIAGAVVITDGIAFTTGRLALLDGIVAAFTTSTLAVIATAISRPLDVPLRRRCEIAAGLLLGAAVASKWSAAPLVPVAALVLGTLGWRAFTDRRARRLELLRSLATVLLLPIAVYGVAYVPTIANFEESAIGREWCSPGVDCTAGLPTRIRETVANQRSMWRFHESLVPMNRYANNAWSWVFQTEPVGLLSSPCPSADPTCSDDDSPSVRRIIGISNPAVWVLATVALGFVLLSSLWHHSLRRALIWLWAAALWLPWVVRPRLSWLPFESARPGYTFYAAPLVPALALALAFAWNDIRGRKRYVFGIAFGVLLIVGFAVLYPVWTGLPTSPSYLDELVSPRP